MVMTVHHERLLRILERNAPRGASRAKLLENGSPHRVNDLINAGWITPHERDHFTIAEAGFTALEQWRETGALPTTPPPVLDPNLPRLILEQFENHDRPLSAHELADRLGQPFDDVILACRDLARAGELEDRTDATGAARYALPGTASASPTTPDLETTEEPEPEPTEPETPEADRPAMSIAGRIVAFVRDHPLTLSRDIARAIRRDMKNTSARLTVLVNEGRLVVMDKVEGRNRYAIPGWQPAPDPLETPEEPLTTTPAPGKHVVSPDENTWSRPMNSRRRSNPAIPSRHRATRLPPPNPRSTAATSRSTSSNPQRLPRPTDPPSTPPPNHRNPRANPRAQTRTSPPSTPTSTVSARPSCPSWRCHPPRVGAPCATSPTSWR